jgi:transcriptional regulator with XRE-family HTH domain
VSIGETLAESRQQAGLTITQVSQRTRIRESIIRAIEQGDFSACGGDFYARGHIRSIAAAVGADPVPLIQEYDKEHGPPGAISAADVFEPSTPIKIRERRSFGLGKVMVVVLIAVIGFAGYRLASVKDHHHNSDTAASVVPRVTLSPTARPTPKPAPTHHAVHSSGLVIKLTAVEDCWVMLAYPDGTEIYSGTVLAGATMTWREKHRVLMELGNPGGIVLTIDGKRKNPNATDPVTLSISPDQTVSVSLNPIGQSVGG